MARQDIFVVMRWTSSGSSIHGIFTTRKKAQECKRTAEMFIQGDEVYSIVEHDLQ